MAAYAALVSVMHIIETIQNHPRPPISLDKEQLQSLVENITFLQEFLETHSSSNDGCEDVDVLEGRIAVAAYAAEDVIESHVVDQIEASNNAHGKTISPVGLYDGLHKVIQDLDLIRRDTSNFTKETRIKDDDDDDDKPLHTNYSMTDGGGSSSFRRAHSFTSHDAAVGLDDVLVKVMDKLTGYQSNRQIIPIVGMGGIGKTTLASNIYVNPVIVQYFDFRGWATISQEHNTKETLIEILLCLKTMGSKESLSHMSEEKLGGALYKNLFGRRYLIVLDDLWSIEAWDKVKTFFPNTNDGSAILITTRLSNLAFQLSGSYGSLEMGFLDKDKSWNLFCKCTFGEESESCPRELEGIGKKIVENCKGLPLSIVVVGGLLAKSEKTQEYWLFIARNLNSVVNLEDGERCSKILHLSYKELPVHLKPCFLYMGVFPEDFEIRVPKLMKLWVAEGFLKPISGKCLEVVAKEYFNDLLGRNLIFVSKKGCSGNPKYCRIHDLLADVCVREAIKHKFFCVITSDHNLRNPQDLITQRRIVDHKGVSHGTHVRSSTCTSHGGYPIKVFKSRLLRVWNRFDGNKKKLKSTPRILNCRFLFRLYITSNPNHNLLSSIRSLWNLQTLYVRNRSCEVPTSEIWKMSQLRHVSIDELILHDPPPSGNDECVVLRNLQKLSCVKNFKFSKEVVKRIPNVKKLGIYYTGTNEDWSSCCLNNLIQLKTIESLSCAFLFRKEPVPSELHANLHFPGSLKKLTLIGTNLDLGDVGTKIGSLPHLQVLNLRQGSFVGPEWETVEGQFRSLKYLGIYGYPEGWHAIRRHDLMYWRTESCTHFPCLENLYLYELTKLKEIPPGIGETLKTIKMYYCSDSAIISANEILKEQEDLGNEGLHVKVIRKGKNRVVESLASPNFQVEIHYKKKSF